MPLASRSRRPAGVQQSGPIWQLTTSVFAGSVRCRAGWAWSGRFGHSNARAIIITDRKGYWGNFQRSAVSDAIPLLSAW